MLVIYLMLLLLYAVIVTLFMAFADYHKGESLLSAFLCIVSSAKAISNDNLMEKGLGLSISDEYVTTITFIIIGVSISKAKVRK